jgi:hypothetical protein
MSKIMLIFWRTEACHPENKKSCLSLYVLHDNALNIAVVVVVVVDNVDNVDSQLQLFNFMKMVSVMTVVLQRNSLKKTLSSEAFAIQISG